MALVIVGPFHRKSPAGTFLVALDPPSVKHGEVHHTIHGALLTGSTGCLLRTGRIVEPYIHALYESLGEGDVITRNEHDLAEETRILGYVHNLLDEVLAGLVGRMGLSGEDELNRHLRIVHNRIEPVQVAEEQGCSLVGGETPCETDGEDVVAEGLLDRHYLPRGIVGTEIRIGDLLLDSIYEILLENLPDIPYLTVAELVNAAEAGLVIVMGLEFRSEHLGMESFPLLCRPGRIVYAVGDIAYVKFLRKIARIHIRKDILAHLSVKHGHTVHVLGDVCGEYAHRELLVHIISVDLAQAHKGLPAYAQTLRIVADILAEHSFVEGVMSRRHRCMGGEEGGSPDHLEGLPEVEAVILYVFTESLESGECGVALIAVIYLRIESESPEGAHTAHAEEQFLLEPVLPVSAVELVGYLPVILAVGLEVSVEEIEVGTSDSHFPYACDHLSSGEVDCGGEPVALRITCRLGRNLEEILSLISGLLLTLRGKYLVEVAVSVEEAHCDEVHVHVAGLLEVVTGEKSESAGVDLEG